jgi:anti-sigma B factor antagonist
MTLKLQPQFKDDSAVLFCTGDLVGGRETSELRHAVTELLRERDRVILDLSGIAYMNSGGLSSLVGLYSTARTSGGTIKYVNLMVAIDFSRRQSSSERAA